MASEISSASNGLTMSASVSSSAAPAKRDRISTPGSLGSCAATYSLATRFMPSRSGVTAHRCRHVAQRHPIEFRISTVRIADDAIQFTAQSLIAAGLFARSGSDLQETHMPAVLGILGKQSAEGLEAVYQPLGIIQPVDADCQRTTAKALVQSHGLRAALRT